MKKFLKILFKILGKLILAAVIFFAATFTLYMVNGENKLIYYVVRPLLNKHYDSQVLRPAHRLTHSNEPIFVAPGRFFFCLGYFHRTNLPHI